MAKADSAANNAALPETLDPHFPGFTLAALEAL
jgi:hypothetical protein